MMLHDPVLVLAIVMNVTLLLGGAGVLGLARWYDRRKKMRQEIMHPMLAILGTALVLGVGFLIIHRVAALHDRRQENRLDD